MDQLGESFRCCEGFYWHWVSIKWIYGVTTQVEITLKILEKVRYLFTFYFYNSALVCSSNNWIYQIDVSKATKEEWIIYELAYINLY